MRNTFSLSLCGWVLISLSMVVQAEEPDFAGRWSTTWSNGAVSADMSLKQKGNRVWGSYAYKGGSVSGLLYGKKLRGSWSQSDGKRGTFEFVLSHDNKSFKGKWRKGNFGAWTKVTWNGIRY